MNRKLGHVILGCAATLAAAVPGKPSIAFLSHCPGGAKTCTDPDSIHMTLAPPTDCPTCTLHYILGSGNPVCTSTVYNADDPVSVWRNVEVKAVACDKSDPSVVANKSITDITAVLPQSIANGNMTSVVTLGFAMPDSEQPQKAAGWYFMVTLDGKDPECDPDNATHVNIDVKMPIPYNLQMKVIACGTDLKTSQVFSRSIKVAAQQPEIQMPEMVVGKANLQIVELGETANVTLHFSTTGEATCSSQQFTPSTTFSIDQETRVYAVACGTKLEPSLNAQKTIKVQAVSPVLLSTCGVGRVPLEMEQNLNKDAKNFRIMYSLHPTRNVSCSGSNPSREWSPSGDELVVQQETVQMIACADNLIPSNISRHTITVTAATPVIEKEAFGDGKGYVIITQDDNEMAENFHITYTVDGTDPSCSRHAKLYDHMSPPTITQTTTVKARACGNLLIPSGVATQEVEFHTEDNAVAVVLVVLMVALVGALVVSLLLWKKRQSRQIILSDFNGEDALLPAGDADLPAASAGWPRSVELRQSGSAPPPQAPGYSRIEAS